MSMVQERYCLPEAVKSDLMLRTPRFGFDGLGEIVYYRTYSRLKDDGTQETWPDTVIRVVEGNMSILKDYCVKMDIPFDEQYWGTVARDMADYIYEMRFLPPGRGLWALGSEYVYERGSAALQNCGYIDVIKLSDDAAWTKDKLMCGIGVGFSTHKLPADTRYYFPDVTQKPRRYVIPDSREGWVESLRLLIASYETPNNRPMRFDYSKIRKAGEPIKGFGGTASGPDPLKKLHDRVRKYMASYLNQTPGYNKTRLVTDVMNAIGACVVAGNVRRSAELATGKFDDDIFMNLKNADLFPERQDIAWMSNNSVILETPDDFLHLPNIARQLVRRYDDGSLMYFDDNGKNVDENGERLTRRNGQPKTTGDPGIINLMSTQLYGRFKEKTYGRDNAVGFNPCAEQPLKSGELCCLVEVFPTRCDNEDEIYHAMELSTLFASIVSLLPTHDERTNAVIAENHRIGVSMSGIADWLEATSIANLTKVLRHGYEKVVRPVNKTFMLSMGLKPSIRVTTVKPSGTISQLAGVSPGMHWPTFRYAIRRVRMSDTSPLLPALSEAGYFIEPDKSSDNTVCVEFPIDQGKTRAATEVSMWEQASMLAFLQREWSDNGVSCTIYFDPERESHDLEHLLSMYAPQIKAMSLLGHTAKGYAPQMPYEGIDRATYRSKVAALKPVDLRAFIQAGSSDGMDSRFCEADGKCDIVFSKVA